MIRKILVVDDSDTVRDVVRAVLEHSGYDVIEAEDGYEALDAIDKEVPDLVITDMMMPRMGGAELIKRMTDSPELCGIPVIVVSADINGKEKKALGNGRVVAWVEKPFRINQLIAKVQEGLERSREGCLEGFKHLLDSGLTDLRGQS